MKLIEENIRETQTQVTSSWIGQKLNVTLDEGDCTKLKASPQQSKQQS